MAVIESDNHHLEHFQIFSYRKGSQIIDVLESSSDYSDEE